jgi:hypothetical protein
VGLRGPDEPRKQPARAHVAVRDPDVDERRPQHRRPRGVPDVAAEREGEAEARGGPVDGGYDRLRRLAQRQDKPRHVLLVGEVIARGVAAVGARGLPVAAEIEPDAEPPAGAGEHDRAARPVATDAIELLVKRLGQLRGHRIEPVGAVEGDELDVLRGPLAQQDVAHVGSPPGSGFR